MISDKKAVVDMLGRSISYAFPPKRIISLVPSQTELLYDLGLNEELIAQTIFCIHPNEMHESKTKIGGTKKLKMDLIKSLRPDLIIGNKEENEQQQIEELMLEFPVWMSDIKDLKDALMMIEQVGLLVEKETKAKEICASLTCDFETLLVQTEPKKCLYLIWRAPWMAAGSDTFINDMLKRMGLINVVSNEIGRYPQITNESLIELNPELILLSSEPYPFKEKHIEELKSLLPKAKVLLVDGELFSWYGSRLLKSVKYFKSLRNEISLFQV
jgi:ABC-type Fe3+-hydroxamate transport system substrate-binding protein